MHYQKDIDSVYNGNALKEANNTPKYVIIILIMIIMIIRIKNGYSII